MVALGDKAKDLFRSSAYKYGTGIAGFIYGVDSKYIIPGVQNPFPYPFTFQGIGDMVKQTTGISLPGWSGGAKQTLNIGAIFNNGTYAVIGLELLDMFIDGSFVDTIKKALEPALIGYAVGKVFDDPPQSSQAGYGAAFPYQAAQVSAGSYSSSGRAFSVPMSAPWNA